MKIKRYSVVAIIATAGCLGSMSVTASTIEIPVTALEPGITPLVYGSHAITEIVPGVDIDGYTFQGSSGDQIRVVMAGQTNGFEPQIQLRDPDGVLVGEADCFAGFGTCSSNLDQGLLIDGTYQLNLSDAGSNEAGDYTLHLEQLRPPNNSVRLTYDTPLSETLGHAGDNEILTFLGNSGTGVSVIVEGLTNGLEPHLQIWDPLGVLVGEADCFAGFGTCSTGVDLDLALSGLYTVALFDTGFNEIGDYNATLACTFGDCAAVIPLPAGLPLLGSALSLLFGGRALWRRRARFS